MGTSQSSPETPTAKWVSAQNLRFQQPENKSQQYIINQQAQENKRFRQEKPISLKEPAFSGYVAGWRRGDFDDDAQEFSFASFQSAGYEGDDEEEQTFDQGRESHPPDWPLGPGMRMSRTNTTPDERTWKERKHSPSPTRADVRTGRPLARTKSAQSRSKTISCPRRYLQASTTSKSQNSSHSAVLGRNPGSGPIAKISLSRLREVAREEAAAAAKK